MLKPPFFNEKFFYDVFFRTVFGFNIVFSGGFKQDVIRIRQGQGIARFVRIEELIKLGFLACFFQAIFKSLQTSTRLVQKVFAEKSASAAIGHGSIRLPVSF